MSFSYGAKSLENLSQCDPRLQRVFHEVIKHVNCSIICGHRPEDEQNQAFKEGKSKTPWPQSKHNKKPSTAVDALPYPIDWQDLRRMYMFVGIVRAVAAQLGIKIRCGADWDGDFEIKDQNFHDLPHFELVD